MGARSSEQRAASTEAIGSSGLTITIVTHPCGYLMRIEHEGASMVLDRDEALALHAELNAKLGAMPVTIP